jgi:hypothetical protein
MPVSASQASASSTLIIHNGGYCALLASLMAESEADGFESQGLGRGTLYAWIPPVGCGLFSDEPPHVDGAISARNRAEMVARQAKLMGFREVFAEETPARRQRRSIGALLLRAIELANENRCERVVWPICVGNQLEAVQRVVEQAALASDLAALDHPDESGESAPVRILTPLADLSQADLDRLAEDLSAPLEACWKPVFSPNATL